MPPPADLVIVPLLLKVAVPPSERLTPRLVWKSQDPLLTMTLFCPVRMSALLARVTAPAVFRCRPPEISWDTPTLTVRGPLKVVAPTPDIAPPPQVEAPETVTTSLPLRVPVEMLRVVVLIASPLLKLAITDEP